LRYPGKESGYRYEKIREDVTYPGRLAREIEERLWGNELLKMCKLSTSGINESKIANRGFAKEDSWL